MDGPAAILEIEAVVDAGQRLQLLESLTGLWSSATALGGQA
jgi:hypothetical protein